MTTTKLASSLATALLTHGTYAVGDDRSTLDLSEYRDAASFLHGEYFSACGWSRNQIDHLADKLSAAAADAQVEAPGYNVIDTEAGAIAVSVELVSLVEEETEPRD